MADRILGPQGSKRRKRFLWVPMLLIACCALFVIGSAQAVHETGAFELEGNAVSANASGLLGPSNDWDRVCHEATGSAACGTSSNTVSPAAKAVSWSGDCLGGTEHTLGCGNLSATTFTGGGSKDPQDISKWAWNDGGGGLPAKDNLLHGFAARYSLPGTTKTGTCPNGTDVATGSTFDSSVNCEVLFFGSDRWDNSGDAQQGFWFFQNAIGLGTAALGGGTAFTGVHKNGDVLVISDFSIGGTTSSITVYAWDSSCTKAVTKPVPGDCGDINLRLKAQNDTAKCASGGAGNDGFCGIVNPDNTTPVPWDTDFTDKSGNSSTYLQGELYEGGINLSLLGLGGECFSSIGAESRASTSTTATLKDFILGSFAQCTPGLTTTASANGTTIQPGTPAHDTATITVTGGSSPPDPTGTVNFFLCSDPSSSPACTSGGTAIGSGTLSVGTLNDGISTADSPSVNCTSDAQSGVTPACKVGSSVNPLSNGFYCFRAEWAGDATYGTFNPPVANVDNTNECFRVLQLTTTTVTSPQSPAGTNITGNVALGTSNIVDYALVTGSAAGGPPPGSVNFYICTPSQVTGTGSSAHCAGTGASGDGTALADNPRAVSTVTGTNNSQATSSPAVTANQLGVWCFRADYVPTGAVYTGSSDNSNGECFTVTTSSSASSAQNWLPNDHVTISTPTGTLAGTLSITLRSGSCTGTTVYTEPVPNSGAFTATVAGATYDTTNGSVAATTFKVDTSNAGTYYWRIVFTPTSSFGGGAITKCETSTVTVNDNPA